VAKVQLSGSEKRSLLLWVLAGIIGLVYAQRHFFEAFPEASVNFQVTRSEALERARSFVESLGNSTAGYRSAIVFGVNDTAKIYLEREVGLKEANRLMASEVNVWHWQARFFRPGQEEEFRVGVSPEGRISGYLHKIPEAQAGGEPGRDSAQETAQNFLTARLGKNAADWDFLPEEANSAKKPNRLDWSFTWERHAFKAKDAPERLTISLNGTEIGSASETLKVPEQWERDYGHLRSTNEFYNKVAIVPYLLLFGAALWCGIQLTRQGQTSWRLALQLGALVAVALTAMQLNRWPLDLAGYDTNETFGSFTIQQILSALLFGVGSALTVTLVMPGGEPFYREMRPQFLRLKKALTWRGLRSKQFFSSAVVGLSLAAAQMGFLVAFYLIANHFGAWAPQEIDYEDSVSTAIPWIGGIAIGLVAATSEEFLFRMFAIPFLQRVTKSRWLAIVLPAFSWGFLHTAYPNEPPYIRGLEVGLIGIAVGLVMLRWGILATLIWHYTVDASLVGLLLIRSSSWYFRISGLVVGLAVLIPFSYTVYSRLRRGTFEEDEDLLNQAPDPEDAAVREETPVGELAHAPTGPLSKGMLAFLCVCIVLGGLAAEKLKPVHLGDYLKLSVNSREAEARADDIMRQRGVDPASYHRVTTLAVDVSDPTANEYLREKVGVRALNEIYATEIPAALWVTRFFRDGQAEEYSVVLKPDGALHSVHHQLAEAAEGAALTKEQAIEKATGYLQSEKKIDLSGWTLVDASSKKRPHRTDHTLVWQARQPLDDRAGGNADPATHAFARIEVDVSGDQVTGYRTFVKIPDEWRRQQEAESLWRTLDSVFVPVFALALGVVALVFFLRQIRSELIRRVPWRRFAGWGLVALAAYAVLTACGNRIAQTLMNQYPTSMPLKFMYGSLGIFFTIGAFFYMGLVVILFAMGWFFVQRAYGEVPWPGWRGMPGEYYRDALAIGLGGTAAFVALGRATEWVFRHWPTPHRGFSAAFGGYFDCYVPAAAISAGAVLRGLGLAAAFAAVCGFVLAHCKSPIVRALLFVGASLALVSGWGSPADFLKQWIAQLIFLAVVVFGVTRVARMNLLGYFLVLAVPTLILGSEELLAQPNRYYHQQGYLTLAALVALLVWPVAAWMGQRPRTAS
jgi:membrane protease YdiL (CAAX protease family)